MSGTATVVLGHIKISRQADACRDGTLNVMGMRLLAGYAEYGAFDERHIDVAGGGIDVYAVDLADAERKRG